MIIRVESCRDFKGLPTFIYSLINLLITSNTQLSLIVNFILGRNSTGIAVYALSLTLGDEKISMNYFKGARTKLQFDMLS